jgi:hypothetical protein
VKPRSFVEQVSTGLSAEPIADISVIEPDLRRELRRAGAADDAIDLLIATGRAKLDRAGAAEVIGARGWLPAGVALREAIDFAQHQVSAERASDDRGAMDDEIAQFASHRPHWGR